MFGRENILIVSNSSGSSDDPSGLGAEALSRALNVPVLCHKQKKPSKWCAVEALEYFVALSYDREMTLEQAQHMPPGSGTIEAGPSRQTKKYLRERRKVLKQQVPGDEGGNGSVLLVGDRTMTDVVVAHRMNDELMKRRRKLGLELAEGSTSAIPPPQCISVLTTGIWTYEGRLNGLMRKLETRVTTYLIGKGFQPGQPGLFSFRRSTLNAPVDWQKIAAKPFKNSQTVVQRLSKDDAAQFAYTKDAIPQATPLEPTLGTILIATLVRPLPPRIASLLTSLFSSRPFVWILTNMRDGWNVMIKGLEFGVREAGISPSQRSKKIAYSPEASNINSARSEASQGYMIDEVAPKTRAEAKKDAVSASLSDYLESRLPNIGAASQLRTRLTSSSSSPTFSAQSFLTRFTPKSLSTTTPTSITSRTFSTTNPRFTQQSPPPSFNPRGVPRRNWIAAFSALLLLPASYYVGMRLHDLKDSKAIDPTQPLPVTPAKPTPGLHQHQDEARVFELDEKAKRALLKANADRKRE